MLIESPSNYSTNSNYTLARNIFEQLTSDPDVGASACAGLSFLCYQENKLEQSIHYLHVWQRIEPENLMCESLMDTILMQLAKSENNAPLPALGYLWLDSDLLQEQLENKVGPVESQNHYAQSIEGQDSFAIHEIPKAEFRFDKRNQRIKGRSSAAKELSPDIFGNQKVLTFDSSSPANIQHTPPRNRRRLFEQELELKDLLPIGNQFSLQSGQPFEDDIFDDPNDNDTSMELDNFQNDFNSDQE